MTAKEMFEELGYEEYCSKEGCWIRYRKEYKQYSHDDIVFDIKEKTIHKTTNFKVIEISAVYQQCKELGWLKEE
ncbi:MAG: hypothetical protein KBT35_01370 [Firmicutes bacterium]|nr:hypothetical protein [Candidatus Colivicinus equi]